MLEVLNQLEKYCRDRSLVSLRRDDIDVNSTQGLVLGYSSELILIQDVYDFFVDGLHILNIRDITSVESTKTDCLQRKILLEEGLMSDEGSGHDYPLSCWKDLLSHVVASKQIVIIEDEDPADDIFLIGRIARVTDYDVHVHYFNGMAEWEPDPRKMTFEYITRCKLFTNYTNKYQSYFERYPDRDFECM